MTDFALMRYTGLSMTCTYIHGKQDRPTPPPPPIAGVERPELLYILAEASQASEPSISLSHSLFLGVFFGFLGGGKGAGYVCTLHYI